MKRIDSLLYYTQKLGYLKENNSSNTNWVREEEFTKNLSSEEKVRVYFLWAKQQLLEEACRQGILSEENRKRLLQRSLQSSLKQGELHLRSLKEGLLSLSQVKDIIERLETKGILLSWEQEILVKAALIHEEDNPEKVPLPTLSSHLSQPDQILNAQLGPYKILEEIGSGGVGKVYKARHQQLDKTVAIKVLLQDSEIGEIERGRFLAEAKLIAKLNHPNIVRAQDFGNMGGQDYIVMDLIEGQSLGQILGSGKKYSFREGVKILRDVALAISYAHEEGFIHRDLKPANLMIDKREGKPLVMDFGLAKNLRGAKDITKTGEILGTPRYMAPEQTGGQGSQVSALTDVYALGAILYEVITGHKAINGESFFNIVYRIVHGEIIPPRQLVSSIALDLETICMKALEKDPAKRYSSAQAMADDMTRFLEGEMVLARPHNFWQKARKKIYKNRVFVASAALLFCGIMITFAWNQRVLRQRASVEEVIANWNVWWNDWEENFQQDYSLLQSLDYVLEESEELISQWQTNPEKTYQKWASYDERLFLIWQKYEKELASFPSFFSKYTSLGKTYDRLKEKKQWKELQLSEKGKERWSRFLSKTTFSFSEEMGNPAYRMLENVSEKIVFLEQRSQSVLEEYKKKRTPSLLEKTRWYLSYGEKLLEDVHLVLQQSELTYLAKVEKSLEQIRADRENFLEQAWERVSSDEYSGKVFFLFRKLDYLEEICLSNVTDAKAYYQLARTKHQLGSHKEARIAYEKCNQREKQALSFFYLMDIYFSLSRSMLAIIQRNDESKEFTRSYQLGLEELMEQNLQSFEEILLQTRSLEKRQFFGQMQNFYYELTQAEKYISESYSKELGGSSLELFLVPWGTNRKSFDKLESRVQTDYEQGVQKYHNLLFILNKVSGSYLPQWISHWKSVIYLDLDLLGEYPAEGNSYLERALVVAQEAVKKEPINSRFQQQLAKVYSTIGDYAQVAKIYQRISPPINIDMDLNDFSYAWDLNQHYYLALFRQGEIKKAQKILESYLNYFHESAHKYPVRLVKYPLEKVYERSSIYWLALVYFQQNKNEKIREIFSHWRCHLERPNVRKGETFVKYWIYFICALKVGEEEKGIQALEFLWEGILEEYGTLASKLQGMSLLLESQSPFLHYYEKILNSPARYRKLSLAFIKILDKMQKKQYYELSSRLLDRSPLIKMMAQSVEKDPVFAKKVYQVVKKITGSGGIFQFTFQLIMKLEIDFREQRLRRMEKITSSKVLVQRATGFYRQSLYTKDNLIYLKKALRDILLALEKKPTNSDYHYACALLYVSLSKKEKDYSYLTLFHLRLASELGWSHFDFLTPQDSLWKSFLSQPQSRLWMKRPQRNLLDYPFGNVKKRAQDALAKGYKEQAKQITHAYQKLLQKQEIEPFFDIIKFSDLSQEK